MDEYDEEEWIKKRNGGTEEEKGREGLVWKIKKEEKENYNGRWESRDEAKRKGGKYINEG